MIIKLGQSTSSEDRAPGLFATEPCSIIIPPRWSAASAGSTSGLSGGDHPQKPLPAARRRPILTTAGFRRGDRNRRSRRIRASTSDERLNEVTASRVEWTFGEPRSGNLAGHLLLSHSATVSIPMANKEEAYGR
jgi:hypothetical protein